MEQLNVKVHEYDQGSNSLIVSFSSDVSKNDVDSYQKLAFQPANFDTLDPQEILKLIAKTGVRIAKIQDQAESLIEDQASIDAFNALAGTTTTWNISELVDPITIDPVTPNTSP